MSPACLVGEGFLSAGRSASSLPDGFFFVVPERPPFRPIWPGKKKKEKNNMKNKMQPRVWGIEFIKKDKII